VPSVSSGPSTIHLTDVSSPAMKAETEYDQRLAARKAATGRWNRWEGHIANFRFVIALSAAALLFPIFGSPDWPGGLILLPVAAFLVLVVVHERVIKARDRALRAEAFYERGLDRIHDRWHGKGNDGKRYLDPNHPYAGDLDVFGKGSLFELLCTARTRAGEDTLAARLSEPADPEVVRERQEAVTELRDRLDLREEIALLGDDLPVGVRADAIDLWGRAPIRLMGAAVPITATVLGAWGLAALVAYFGQFYNSTPLILMVLIGIFYRLPIRKRVEKVLAAGDRPTNQLDLFSRILARIEEERFDSALLVRLREELETGGVPPSKEIRKLVLLYQLVDARRNLFFFPIAWLALWEVQLAYAIERWRAAAGEKVAAWLRAVGEIETLLALASYTYERPADEFPELSETGPHFEAKGITHPLLPAADAVRNDLSLGDDLRLFVVSGSNMSGKTTLLRTVGTNLVLAYAGAPVRAERLTVSSIQTAAGMRVRDSLLEGSSLFYAEIKRLKLVVDLAEGDRPVLFLLDELLSGTNSNDRAAGAEGLVRGLLDRGAIGLITTHDLALGRIAEELAPRAANVHFEDQLTAGRMSFDYTLRDGVVTKSNALELMRAVGLEV